MKIAVISDIHDNIGNLNLFFDKIKNQQIEKIIFLWDLVSASTVLVLSSFEIPVFSILWNNNWDLCRVKDLENEFFEQSCRPFDFLEIDSKKIFLTHYNEFANSIAKSWDFDAVFYWHNHIKYKEKVWNCLVLNPWEISWSKTWEVSFAIYDSKTNDAEIINIK